MLESEGIDSQRFKIISEIVMSIAHDIGTPLNVAMGSAEVISASSPDGSPQRKAAGTIVSQTHRIKALLDRMIGIVREPPRSRPEPQSLDALAADAAQLARHLVVSQGARLGVAEQSETGSKARVDPSVFSEAVFAIVHAVLERVEGKPHLTLHVENAPVPSVTISARSADGDAIALATLLDESPGPLGIHVARWLLEHQNAELHRDDQSGGSASGIRIAFDGGDASARPF